MSESNSGSDPPVGLDGRPQKVALFIDAENMSPKDLPMLLQELHSSLGQITVRRAYGKFSKQSLKGWLEPMQVHAITPVMTLGSGKNASDIALTVDAMDMLHTIVALQRRSRRLRHGQ